MVYSSIFSLVNDLKKGNGLKNKGKGDKDKNQ